MKPPLLAATLTLVTLAVSTALAAFMPPFPAPKLIGVTAETKCDWGPVTEVKSDRTLLVVRTEAGPFEVKLLSGLKVAAAADGRQLSAPELRAGQNVRVYYVVDHGARALEIDVLP